MISVYCVYDMDNFEQIVYMAEKLKDVSSFLGRSKETISHAIYKGCQIRGRYLVKIVTL